MPLPGTSLEDWAVKNGAMNTRDVSALDGFLQSVLQYPGLGGDEIDRFIEETYAEYQSRRNSARAPSQRESSPDASQSLVASAV
jgi:hypothetical protein